jgi:hypothetical protein
MPASAATVCEFDLVTETNQVMQPAQTLAPTIIKSATLTQNDLDDQIPM